MRKAKGLILCGGTGTRLRPITYYFQKSMIPVGLKQKPLLEYVVRLLKYHGISDLTFLVSYKSEQIQNYFDDGSRFGVKMSYVHDDSALKGTGGSVLNVYRQGLIKAKDLLLVYYGDILTNLNVKGMLQFHEEKGADATVAVASGFSVRVGLADMDKEGKIHNFVEKPTLEKPVSIGILAFKGTVLQNMEELLKGNGELDLMRDVIPYLISKGGAVYGYLSKAFWYDVGSTEAYEKLDHKLVDNMFSFLFK